MEKFRIVFSARKKGAIGLVCTFYETIEADSPDDFGWNGKARLALYERYDHIGPIRIFGKEKSKEAK